MTAGGLSPLAVRAIGIIGAGPAGREFTRECVRAGYAVVLEDVMPAKLRQAAQEVTDLAGIEGLGSLHLASTVEDAVREADLVIDFVPDELESKLEILSMADRMAPPRTILCTPTKALSISDLASCVYRPERCIAVEHLADREVSVVTPPLVSPDVLHAISVFFQSLGRVVTVTTDSTEPMLTKVASRQ